VIEKIISNDVRYHNSEICYASKSVEEYELEAMILGLIAEFYSLK
jgi:hypothetical protein